MPAAAVIPAPIAYIKIVAVYVQLIPITKHIRPVLVFLVTTSLRQDWVICAPAAFLRCGSRFSGSLSGIEP